jgi:hypothetical protein
LFPPRRTTRRLRLRRKNGVQIPSPDGCRRSGIALDPNGPTSGSRLPGRFESAGIRR